LATGSVFFADVCAGVTGDCASATGGGAGKERTSFLADSTTPSIGDPGAERDSLPRDRSQDGEWLAAARGEGDEGTGRSSEPAGSGEKSAAATRSSRVKMGGGGGVAEGAAAGDAPEAKREVLRWVGIGEARSRKKGDCRAARREEEAIARRRQRESRVWASGVAAPFPYCTSVERDGALGGGEASRVFVADRGSLRPVLYWAVLWLEGPATGRSRTNSC
jgi:hypothetical protein